MTDLLKPVRRVVRNAAARGSGFSPDIAVTLYPGGVLGFRELRRRKEYKLSVEGLMALAVRREVEAARAAKRKGRGRVPRGGKIKELRRW